jgi:hypothetical protein
MLGALPRWVEEDRWETEVEELELDDEVGIWRSACELARLGAMRCMPMGRIRRPACSVFFSEGVLDVAERGTMRRSGEGDPPT